jgi:transcriptional regulator with XRE-family HTH domain
LLRRYDDYTDLAERMGVHGDTLRGLARGKYPNVGVRTAEAILIGLGYSLADFYPEFMEGKAA